MLRRIGPAGFVGLLMLLGGIGVVAWRDPIVATGLALVLAGIGLLAKGMIDALVASLGFGGSF